MEPNKEVPPNILIFVLDSLRYDVALGTEAPNFKALFEAAGAGSWRRCFAPGTYTLPSHISMFQAGLFPSDPLGTEPFYNHRLGACFRGEGALFGKRPALFVVPAEAPNIIKGLSMMGYETMGIGGVGWFDRRMPTTDLWNYFFNRFVWNNLFHENEPAAFESQLDFLGEFFAARKEGAPPLCLFINCPSTHTPYLGHGRSLEGQSMALQYVDQLLPTLVDMLPKPLHFFALADHGDCFGESGLWGHSMYHPAVMEVPFCQGLLEGEVQW